MQTSGDDLLAIAGGGIGGLTLAAALARNRIPCKIFEQAPELGEVGAGLLLAPNATAVLDRLGLLGAITNAGRANTRWRILDDAGLLLGEVTMPPELTPAISILRWDLVNELHRRLPPDTLQLGSLVVGYAQQPGGIRLRLQDKGQVRASALVGADGIRSRIRAQLLGEEQAPYSGYVGWRGIADYSPPEYEDGIISESWGPGGRFGIAPVGSNRTYWYASANRPEGWRDDVSQRQAGLLSLFGHWHKPVADLIAATPSESILLNEIRDRPPCRGWSQGRITLLGDAAHPMTPNLGQGACLAIEDAFALASMLASHDNVEQAFLEYERRRFPRTAALQRQSRWFGWVVQAENALLVRLRSLSMRATPSWVSRASMQKIFAYPPE